MVFIDFVWKLLLLTIILSVLNIETGTGTGTGLTNPNKTCSIRIDCDSHCQDNLNPSDIIDIVSQSISPFPDHLIKFQLEDVVYHSRSFSNIPNASNTITPNVILSHYANQITHYTTQHNLSYCTSILLTTFPDEETTVGMAFKGYRCSSYGVGIVDINQDAQTYILTLAHEIGHILGLPHTCQDEGGTSQNSCLVHEGSKCNPVGHKYLMYPYVSSCSRNYDTLSPCSIDILGHQISGLNCLTNDTGIVARQINKNCYRNNYYVYNILLILFFLMGTTCVFLWKIEPN